MCGAIQLVFNPNIGKLGFQDSQLPFYWLFKQVRESMVTQEISLEEKRVQVPTSMNRESIFFSIPIAAALTACDNVVTTPVVSSPMTTTNEN